MEARFIVDDKGNKKEVVLSIEDFRSLIEELETQEDIRAVKKALDDKDDVLLNWDTAKKSLVR